jgi:Fe-S-cluster-containing hydrogenase component 2
MASGRIEIIDALCKGCELCTQVCPKDLLSWDTARPNWWIRKTSARDARYAP